jgi:hypothetical protein
MCEEECCFYHYTEKVTFYCIKGKSKCRQVTSPIDVSVSLSFRITIMSYSLNFDVGFMKAEREFKVTRLDGGGGYM